MAFTELFIIAFAVSFIASVAWMWMQYRRVQ